jgi:hypothetical protein
MSNRIGAASAAFAIGMACLVSSASAQKSASQQGNAPASSPAAQTWTSADGGLHFTIPAGWKRLNPSAADAGKDVLVAANGDTALNCRVEIAQSAQAAPGETQATMNTRVAAGAGNLKLDEKRVNTAGGVVAVDGFLPMQPRILIVMNVIYFHGGKFYMTNARCGRTQAPADLTMDHLKLARTFFDTINATP